MKGELGIKIKKVLFFIGMLAFIGAVYLKKIGDHFACSIVVCNDIKELVFESNFRNIHYSASTGGFIPRQTRKIQLSLIVPQEFRINKTPIIKFIYNEFDEFVSLSEGALSNSNSYEQAKGLEFSLDEIGSDKIFDSLNDSLTRAYVQSKKSSESSQIELGSSAFDVYPSKAMSITEGKDLPLELTWTATPKKTGNHDLILNIGQLIDTMAFIKDSTYKINGKELKLPRSGSLVIPISVLTEWGITDRLQFIVKGILSLIGFILMWPLFFSWWQKRNS